MLWGLPRVGGTKSPDIARIVDLKPDLVFANAEPAAGRKGITAFLVPSETAGLSIDPIAMSVDHPIGTLRFVGCRLLAAGQGSELSF